MSHYRQLKQRKLVQWAVAYLAASWGLLQILDLAADNYGWPTLVVRLAFGVIALGFVVTLVLAWYHGERGIQKVSGIELLVLALLFAIGGGLLWRYANTEPAQAGSVARDTVDPAVSPPVAPPADKVDPKSVAVLPFSSMSSGKDDAYFADGLSEEVINSLSRVPDLRVSGRTSSFAFRNSEKTIPQIASELNVATVLEGSVRRAGDRLRMTAQLVRASDGFELWSETYDRNNEDIIAIQEDVARSIAQALKTATDPEALAAMQQAGTRSVSAYQAFLRGLAIQQQPDEGASRMGQALAAFDEATRIDPGFSDAYARAADMEWSMLRPSAMGAQEASTSDYADRLRRLHQDLDRASAHARTPVERSYYDALRASANQQFVEALRLMKHYSRAYPNDPAAYTYIGQWSLYLGDYAATRSAMATLSGMHSSVPVTGAILSLSVWAGDGERAAAYARQALEGGSAGMEVVYQAHRALLTAGATDEAATLLPQLLDSDLPPLGKVLVQVRQACAEGRIDDARRLHASMAAIDDPDTSERWHVLQLLGRPEEASRQLAYMDTPAYFNALSSFMVYPNFDLSRYPNLESVMVAQGIHRPPPQRESYACKPGIDQ